MEKSLLVGDETRIDLVRTSGEKVLDVEEPTEKAPELIQDAVKCLDAVSVNEPKSKGKSAGSR